MKKLFALLGLLAPGLLFAQAAPATPGKSGMEMFLMIAIVVIFFYLIMWRPEQKRRKAMEARRSSMKKGDRVTAMGIIGTISKVEENTVIVKMVDGAKVEFLKAAITEVIPSDEKEKEAKK